MDVKPPIKTAIRDLPRHYLFPPSQRFDATFHGETRPGRLIKSSRGQRHKVWPMGHAAESPSIVICDICEVSIFNSILRSQFVISVAQFSTISLIFRKRISKT